MVSIALALQCILQYKLTNIFSIKCYFRANLKIDVTKNRIFRGISWVKLKSVTHSPGNFLLVEFKEMTESIIEKLKTERKSRNNINERVEEMTEILIKVSTKCLKITKNRHKSSKPNQKKHFGTDCYNMRREVRRLAIILSKSPHDTDIRNSYHQIKKQYKQILKVKKRNFKRMALKRLNNLKPFEIKKKWELIKALTSSKNTNDPAEGISIDRWKIYSEKLSKSEKTHDKPPDKPPDHVFDKRMYLRKP